MFKLEQGGTMLAPGVPIGKPISNTQVYVLDGRQQLVAVGVVGEVCLSGAGLARGYLNQAELTAEKFIAHPFLPGQKLYRTGDLGRWLAEGNLEYLGRKDEQVKLRGYRIELGEIEAALLECEGVEAAVVVARTLGQATAGAAPAEADKALVAYLVSEQEPEVARLRKQLAERLPAYMVPAHYVALAALPLNANGKVDKKQLPLPEHLLLGSPVVVAPRNAVEERLLRLWQQVLGRESISVTDNFFELGGHSLKAMRLLSQIHKAFNVKVKVQDLLHRATIESIGKEISRETWMKENTQDNLVLEANQCFTI
jgi:tyrocidine synthetase-3